jgi:hypothetical protein
MQCPLPQLPPALSTHSQSGPPSERIGAHAFADVGAEVEEFGDGDKALMEPGDLSMLKPGVQFVSLVRPLADGTAVALMVSVGGHF